MDKTSASLFTAPTAPKRTGTRLLTGLLVALMALFAMASIGEAQTTDLRFVTIDGNDAGWVLSARTGPVTGQWLSPECRQRIEGAGATFDVVAWEEIEGTAVPQSEQTCDSLVNQINPPAAPQPRSGNELSLAEVGLVRGINAGDFEVAPRGAWGQAVTRADMRAIAAAGFDHVRLPIRWSSHTGPAPAFTIAAGFAAEVDRAVGWAIAEDLTVIVNVHHFEELDADPAGQRNKFLAIWRQLGEAYADAPDNVVFELLNEPVGAFDDDPMLWNTLAAEALAEVRRTNPQRPVIIGPVSYNHPALLPKLQLPDDDYLIATIHTYDPVSFTHQGAVWSNPVPPTGVVWKKNRKQIDAAWADVSWGIGAKTSRKGIRVTFKRQHSALGLSHESPKRAQTLQLSVDTPFDAAVLCNYEAGDPVVVPVDFNRSGDAVVDVSGCGKIESLAVQSLETERTRVWVDEMALCANRCTNMIVSQNKAIKNQFKVAAAWARTQGVPLYAGEFGSLSLDADPADPKSRASWTRAVRTAAEKRNVGWGVFALHGEFGLYDSDTGEWDQSLLDALFGN